MKRTLAYILVCFIAGTAMAQTQRMVSVSPTEAFEDSLTLMPGSDAADLHLKFVFDQDKSTLTVTMQSEKMLHVFRRDAKYRNVVGKNIFHPRRIKLFKLPYNVESTATARYKIAKSTKKLLAPRKQRKNYVFHQWDEVGGMQPVNTKYNMVNDNIEQVYKIDPTANSVTFNLRDVMTLEHDPAHPNKFENYVIDNLKDFNMQYQIVLLRDPCLGKDSLIAEASKLHKELQDAINSLNEAYPDGKTSTMELLDMFQNTRNGYLAKYGKRDEKSTCQDLQNTIDAYNACVDSLQSMTCTLTKEGLQKASEAEFVTGVEGRVRHIDSNSLLFKARQLDELVAQWKSLPASKTRERLYLLQQCDKVIADTEMQIKGRLASTPEQKKALETMRRAINYYNTVCK